ncbi:MAG: DNA polymerase III subunit beta [Bacilli bacterium]
MGVGENDKLILTGSDSEVSIKNIINADDNLIIEEGGTIVIEAKTLGVVRKIDSDFINFEIIDGNLVKISGDSSEFKINAINANDYPNIDFEKGNKSISIDSNILRNVIESTTFAASDKENRPILTGVNFKSEEGILEAVCTDSFRLAKKVIRVDNLYDFNVTIPAKILNDVAKILDHEGNVSFFVTDKKIQFEFSNTIIQSRLIDGKYPDTSKLIPISFTSKLTLNSQDILNAIDRASFIKNDGIAVVKLTLSSSEAIVSSNSQKIGSSKEELLYENYQGDPISISFLGKYVYDAVRYLNTNKVSIEFTTDMKPFVIRDIENDSTLQLIVPVRTY